MSIYKNARPHYFKVFRLESQRWKYASLAARSVASGFALWPFKNMSAIIGRRPSVTRKSTSSPSRITVSRVTVVGFILLMFSRNTDVACTSLHISPSSATIKSFNKIPDLWPGVSAFTSTTLTAFRGFSSPGMITTSSFIANATPMYPSPSLSYSSITKPRSTLRQRSLTSGSTDNCDCLNNSNVARSGFFLPQSSSCISAHSRILNSGDPKSLSCCDGIGNSPASQVRQIHRKWAAINSRDQEQVTPVCIDSNICALVAEHVFLRDFDGVVWLHRNVHKLRLC